MTHKNYERFLALAVASAHRLAPESFIVYYDDTDIYLYPASVPKPLGAIVECIAQRWDDKTVQLRFRGARSEWRYV
jgi:hypothetical protein